MDKSSPATKKDLNSLEQRIDKKLNLLEFRIDKKLDKIMNMLDSFVGVVDNLRIDNIVATKQYRDHEQRISKLEDTVFKF